MSQQSSWERWAPLSGVGFIALLVLGFAIAGSSPSSDDSNVKIAAYLAKDSNQTKNLVAWVILLVALLFAVWFFATLRNRLVAAEGGVGQRGSVALAAGITSTVFLVIAISIFVSPLVTADDADKFKVDPGLYRLTQDLGYMIWVASAVVGSLAAWATAATVFRTGMLPRWFGWFSVVAGILSLFGVLFFPIFVFWLWIVVTSILLFTRSAEAAPAGA